MGIYEAEDYKLFVNSWIKSQPKSGHGLMGKMATYLKVNSVIITQVFRGSRELTLEQAFGVSQFLGLNKTESHFFILLVEKARAGTKELRAYYVEQVNTLRSSSKLIKNRVKHDEVSIQHKTIFYSSWKYSAVRLASSISDLKNSHDIANHLGIDFTTVNQILEFLIEAGLLQMVKGRYELGTSVTHLGHDSPLVNRHHTNWRLQGLRVMENKSEEDLFFSGPMVISTKLAKKIRSDIVSFIQETVKEASSSQSEELHCLGIDWYKIN